MFSHPPHPHLLRPPWLDVSNHPFSFVWFRIIPDEGSTERKRFYLKLEWLFRCPWLLTTCRASTEADEQCHPFIHCLFSGMYGVRMNTHTPLVCLQPSHTHIRWTKSICSHTCSAPVCPHVWVRWLSWVKGSPPFLCLLGRSLSVAAQWDAVTPAWWLGRKYHIKGPYFLRLCPHLDNLVHSRAEEELTRSTAQDLFAFIKLTIGNDSAQRNRQYLIKTFRIKTLIDGLNNSPSNSG